MADEIWTVLKVLRWTQARFAEKGLATPRLDAELLLAKALDSDRIGLYTRHDQPLDKDELAACRALIRRRLDGEPVAYIIGKKEFWSLSFTVDERVLVPRPETELLVETALETLRGREAANQVRIADVGTGSGAIAVALALELRDAEVLAVDVSEAALEVARKNAADLGARVEFLRGDLLDPLVGREPFDAIVSNPPYIPDAEFAALPPEVRREPRGALLGGADGLRELRRLVEGGRRLLKPGGLLAMEVGAGQAEAVAELLRSAGYVDVLVRADLAGIGRVVAGRSPA